MIEHKVCTVVSIANYYQNLLPIDCNSVIITFRNVKSFKKQSVKAQKIIARHCDGIAAVHFKSCNVQLVFLLLRSLAQ
jgi:hypothetical protein